MFFNRCVAYARQTFQFPQPKCEHDASHRKLVRPPGCSVPIVMLVTRSFRPISFARIHHPEIGHRSYAGLRHMDSPVEGLSSILRNVNNKQESCHRWRMEPGDVFPNRNRIPQQWDFRPEIGQTSRTLSADNCDGCTVVQTDFLRAA